MSGRAGFGKSHFTLVVLDAFRNKMQRDVVNRTTATAAENIRGARLHNFLQLSKGFESAFNPSNLSGLHIKKFHPHRRRRYRWPQSTCLPLRIMSFVKRLYRTNDRCLSGVELPSPLRSSANRRRCPLRFWGWSITTAPCTPWAFRQTSACTTIRKCSARR